MRMEFPLYLILVIFVVFFNSCKQSDKDIIQTASIPNGDYFAIDSSRGLQLQARYLPPEMLALKESDSKEVGSKDYEKLKAEFSNQLLFKVNFKWNSNIDFLQYDLANQNEYYERLNYFTTRAAQDFRMVIDKDTVLPAFCQVERTYGQTPFLTLLVAFPKKISKSNAKLIYNAAVWSRGIIQMNFKSKIF